MSRRTAGGELLNWRLTPSDTRFGGLVPFLIDRGPTPHPASREADSAAIELAIDTPSGRVTL